MRGFECQSCKGHLVRAKPIETFLDQYGADKFSTFMALARAAPPSPRPLGCPACGTRSYRAVRHGMVEIDVCASCLCVYFDAGEAALYLRHALVRKFGTDAASTTADSVDGIEALIDLLTDFLD